MLFSILARGIRTLQNWPRTIVVLHILVALALIWPTSQMSWRLGFADLLSENHPSRVAAEKVENKFGGFGKLLVVVHSADSAFNSQWIQDLSNHLKNNPLVNFTESRTESDFFRKHQLLYIRKHDLELIRERVNQQIKLHQLELNPFFVQMDDSLDQQVTPPPFSLADLEGKYLSRLRPHLGNADGTIQLLEVYPRYPINQLEDNRSLVRNIKNWASKNPLTTRLEVTYTGEVYQSAVTGGTLLQEIRRIAWISAAIILLFLVVWFIRQPQIPLVAAIPLGLSLMWSIGMNAMLFGEMNLFTLILTLVIPGLAADHLTHFLTHYADERRRGLGPDLALESTVLGIGPVITVISLASAIAFLALLWLPLQGLRQMGIMGALGVLSSWISVMLFLPILLTVLQRSGHFRIYGATRPSIDLSRPKQYTIWKKLLPPIILITIILASQGFFPDFEYRFSALESDRPTRRADQLLEQAGIPTHEPAVILGSGPEQSAQIITTLQARKASDSTRTIERVIGISSLLPSEQEGKLLLLAEIRAKLTPEVLAKIKGNDSINIAKLSAHWDPLPLTIDDLPYSFRRKFQGRDSSFGEFTFIFPAIDVDDGRECRRFANDLAELKLPDGSKPIATGTAILRADVLNQSLPWMERSIWIAIVALIFLLALYLSKPAQIFFVIIPPAIGFLWFLSLLTLLGIKLNPFSAQVFPMLIGISISGSLHLWYQYKEKSTGSVLAVLKHTAPTVTAATVAVAVCFTGLLFSSHPGFRSMGVVAVIGLFVILIAQISLFPAMVGWLDWRRFRKGTK